MSATPRATSDSSSSTDSRDARQLDVAVIIALPEELQHIDDLLPVAHHERRQPGSGDRQFFFDYDLRHSRAPLRCLVHLLVEMGEVEGAIATQAILHDYEPKLLVNIGLSGSLDKKAVRLGDVVVADSVDRYLADSKSVKGPQKTDLRFKLSPKSFECAIDCWKFAYAMFQRSPEYAAWQEKGIAERKALAAGLPQPMSAAAEKRMAQLLDDKHLGLAPVIVTGPIASGPTVVASRALVNLLKENKRKRLAVDMESGGVMTAQKRCVNTAKTMIIRGISDLADHHKSRLEEIAGTSIRRLAMRNATRALIHMLRAGLLDEETSAPLVRSARPAPSPRTAAVAQWHTLRTNQFDTYTIPMFTPPEGDTIPSDVWLTLRDKEFHFPPDILALIDEAYEKHLYAGDKEAKADIRMHPDLAALAPTSVREVSPEDRTAYEIDFAKSSYRAYLAMATSRILAQGDSRFKRLAEFAATVATQDRRPTEAAVSMGVRVLVRGSDNRLLVSFRDPRQVKMNPDCWSVSANEGIRLDPYMEYIREHGGTPPLTFFVQRAMQNELGFTSDDVAGAGSRKSNVLSIYANTYSQWGIGVLVSFDELAEAQLRHLLTTREREHGWEHKYFQFLPADSMQSFAQALARLQRDAPGMGWERWYGGALESICAYFRWLHLGKYGHLEPETAQLQQAADDLSAEFTRCGVRIHAVDGPNASVFKR